MAEFNFKINNLTYIALLSIYLCVESVRVEVSAPMNPIHEGSILSIRCQIWNLPSENYQVTIFRTTPGGQHEMIAVDDHVTLENDNAFLAERQMTDGSIVYLLSVIYSPRSAAGEYVCKLRDIIGILTDLPSDSIHLQFFYFPSKSDPVCTSDTKSIVSIGSNVTVTCSSDIGSPPVSIQWQSDGETDIRHDKYEKQGRKYAVLKFQVSKYHAGAMFSCKVSSVAFPQRTQTCHYGPIVLEGIATNELNVPHTEIPSSIFDEKQTIPAVEKPPVTSTNMVEQCAKECSDISLSRQLYWVISAIITGGLAFILLVLVLVLCLRYQRANNIWNYQEETQARLREMKRERLYAELQTKQRESVIYMSLSRDNKRVQKHVSDVES